MDKKMFAVLVKYTRPLDQIDAVLAAHRAYLRTHCDAGSFVVTGPQVPRRETFYGTREIWVRAPGGHVIGFAAA